MNLTHLFLPAILKHFGYLNMAPRCANTYLIHKLKKYNIREKRGFRMDEKNRLIEWKGFRVVCSNTG
jgi:hypothetical protein